MRESRKTLYTRRVLKESLLELLEMKPISKITVKELCNLADINRSTFYSHYKDVYDMVEQMEDHMVESVMKNINIKCITSEHQLEAFEAIFNELKNSKDELRLVYLNPESMKCFDRFFDRVYEFSAMLLREHFSELDESQIKHVYGFISRGCAQMVVSWIESGMKEKPRTMANLMSRALKGDFYY